MMLNSNFLKKVYLIGFSKEPFKVKKSIYSTDAGNITDYKPPTGGVREFYKVHFEFVWFFGLIKTKRSFDMDFNVSLNEADLLRTFEHFERIKQSKKPFYYGEDFLNV
jgi:hypothetical protein